MGKLVRDRIPEIIRGQGRTAETRSLDDEAYRAALLDRLVERGAFVGRVHLEPHPSASRGGESTP